MSRNFENIAGTYILGTFAHQDDPSEYQSGLGTLTLAAEGSYSITLDVNTETSTDNLSFSGTGTYLVGSDGAISFTGGWLESGYVAANGTLLLGHADVNPVSDQTSEELWVGAKIGSSMSPTSVAGTYKMGTYAHQDGSSDEAHERQSGVGALTLNADGTYNISLTVNTDASTDNPSFSASGTYTIDTNGAIVLTGDANESGYITANGLVIFGHVGTGGDQTSEELWVGGKIGSNISMATVAGGYKIAVYAHQDDPSENQSGMGTLVLHSDGTYSISLAVNTEAATTDLEFSKTGTYTLATDGAIQFSGGFNDAGFITENGTILLAHAYLGSDQTSEELWVGSKTSINIVDASGTGKYIGSSGDDLIYGDAANDKITAGDGDNIIYAGEGKNSISSGTGDDEITAGAGNDKILAGAGNNLIDAGAGNNNISTLEGDDQISCGTGNDKILAGEGTNTIDAGNGNNSITTGSGDDEITAGTGNDKVLAGAGNNRINAGEGNNNVSTLGGNDQIVCGTGNDKIAAGDGVNIVNAGDGNNTITTGINDDLITTGAGKDKIKAGDGENTIDSGAENDSVASGIGDDIIDAGAGNDKIDAGAGNDWLTGGTGADKLTGGLGADHFVFDNLAIGGFDTITDFSVDDTLEFDTQIFSALSDEISDFHVIGTGNWSADGSSHLIFNAAKGILYYDANGDDGLAGIDFNAIQIAVIKGQNAKLLDSDDLSFI